VGDADVVLFLTGPNVGGPYGPYIQSQRLPVYQEAADKLLEVRSPLTMECSSR
jgi:glutamyl-tRNA synthetase